VPPRLNELLIRARPYAPLLVVVAAVGTAFWRGLGVALLVLAGGMLFFAISSLWESVQSLGDDGDLTLDEALALAAPSAEEEKKRSVLRALKDLEYERSVGKVSEEDYTKLSARYREEARQLLQELDKAETPAREKAEKLIAKRLEKEKLAQAAKAKAKPPPEPEPEEEEEEEEDQDQDLDQDQDQDQDQDRDRTICVECGTKNEPDARFCKQCGESMS
jgi:outer membrane biosynthesis protein TonB